MKDLWLIVAVSSNNVIGNKNQLPWHYPEDLKKFKKITTGHPIIMGRKTYESIGRPLPKRINIILSRKGFEAEGCYTVQSLDEAINISDKLSDKEPIIIGGSKIYELALPKVTRMFVTRIPGMFDGDSYFPHVDSKKWELSNTEKLDNGLEFYDLKLLESVSKQV